MTGIICLNKPEGITSFSAVSRLRGITGEKKAGHTGTLDPMATGVLPVMLGGATRFLDYLPDSDKGYRAEFILGLKTDTLDTTGKIISQNYPAVSEAQVRNALDKYRGVITQTPPMYSAVSVDGKRLYELARLGKEIERPSRQVEIKKLDLLSFDGDRCVINVLCSKGTYIRTLIDDLGEELGCGAAMSRLERTYAMGFSTDDCVALNELREMKDNGGDLSGVLIDIEKMFYLYDRICVSQAQSKRFFNGGALSLQRINRKLSDGLYRVCSPDGVFLGLGECNSEKGELSVKRLLVKRD